ncbi:malignant fibrous histiocytoma-amplified sequence 1 homolog [Gigantopelta aegis]|uniref:malignant fibrous histiocytoma-amplified sequence 1 homolog n=1 Tax=Gigantopelta aegis TaxID=1735272 RepID=UPI001B88E43F|nr:malignant fibrous histiocytoma-amplified sequence 1 homolog [Gigantopelta aegis]
MTDTTESMTSESQSSENLRQYLTDNGDGHQILSIPEGTYKGSIPQILYTFELDELRLPFLKLVSFPDVGTELGTLTKMKLFEAAGNYLHRLPLSFAKCTQLAYLNLEFNHFTAIPASIFELVNLEVLLLGDNEIEELPSEIGNLVNLRVLHLGGNCLTDIPDELAQCKKIHRLNLCGKLYPQAGLQTVPKGVCGQGELIDLDLSWQSIQKIPDGFGSLRKLESLNLKGNHLVCVSVFSQYCKKLETMNLTGALRHFSMVPEAIFMLEGLKNLNLTGNLFTEIPSEVCGLKKLKKLSIRRNKLLILPEELFSLEHLVYLELDENCLETIPDGISKLKNLTYLNLAQNQMSSIHEDICNCRSLQNLQLSFNKLDSIPEKICQLGNLRYLSLDNNKLTEIPLLMDRLEHLRETGGLYLYNNSLKKPPQAICNQGVIPLFLFLKEMRISAAKHRRKIILIGAVRAGKTSLRNALFGHSQLTAEHERTWVLERHLWEPESDLRVQILDFGGHHTYSAAHQMFLTPEALHLLVFDYTKYNRDNYDLLIGDWLDAIIHCAPGATIMAVGTHADLCSKEDINDKTDDIIRKMHHEENTKLTKLKQEIAKIQTFDQPEARESSGKIRDTKMERLQEKMTHMQKMLNTRSLMPQTVYAVSCADDLTGIEEFQEGLISRLKESEEKSLPNSWHKFISEIQNYPEKILPWDKALDIFTNMSNMNQSMISLGGSPELSLEMVLKYLHSTGEIVWFPDNNKLKNIVFHHPETLIEMLRTVFRHDFEEVVNFVEEHGSQADLSSARFDILKQDFIKKGLMAYELLKYTLIHFELSTDTLYTFISLMLKFDLCYEVQESSSNPSLVSSPCVLLFPWFFPEEVPESLKTKWPSRTPPNTFELRYCLKFPNKGPPNFFEKISVKLQNHVSDRINWKSGVLARKNLSQMLIQRTQDENGVLIAVSVRGADLPELWGLIMATRNNFISLLQEWPFICYKLNLLCTHCILQGYEDPYQFEGEVLQTTMPRATYWANWCRNYEDDLIPACFVYRLDPDYQDDISRHIQAATEFLKKSMDAVDGPLSLLSDTGLMFVASQVGFEWTQISFRLGLTQAQIEQIQMSHPMQAFHQITTALTTWRDARDVSDDEKISQLLTVLESEEIGKNELADLLRERYDL